MTSERESTTQCSASGCTNALPRLLRAEEVADFLQCSRAHVYAMIDRGEIPCLRLGRAVRVRWQDLQQFVEANVSGTPLCRGVR